MPNNTVPAAGQAIPIDPVITIARELGTAERQREAYELASVRALDVHKSAYSQMEKDASDLTYALRDMLTHRKATSIGGAAIQMCEIISRVDMIWDEFPEDAGTYRIHQNHRAFSRLAYSILDLLSELAEERPERIAYEGIGNQHINPWKTPAELFALRGLDEGEAFLEGRR